MIWYADNLALISETNEGHRYKFRKWREAFESKALKVNLWRTKVMVSTNISKDGCLWVKFTLMRSAASWKWLTHICVCEI